MPTNPAAKTPKPAVKPIPDGYHTVTPYLVVSDCAKLLEFVKQAFDAKPLMDPMTGPGGKIMHAEVKIGDSVVMMANSNEMHGPMPAMLNLYVEDSDAVYAKALGQAEELLRERTRRPQLPPDQVKVPQSPQHREEPRRLPHLLAQRVRSGVGVFHFWSRVPLGHRQCLTKGDLQVQLVLEVLGAIR